MSEPTKVEYRVRQVERYIVTRYHEIDGRAGLETIGEYAQHTVAHEVAYALCKAEHQRLGWEAGDERIKYPNQFPVNGPDIDSEKLAVAAAE